MHKLIFAANIFFSALLFAAGSRELIIGGDFEQDYKGTLHIQRVLRDAEGKVIPHPDGAITDRVQNERVFAGQQALLLEAELGGHAINSNRNAMPVLEGAKYEFSFRYFIASASEKCRVSARVAFKLLDGKYKYLFPEGDTSPGKWHQLKVEFYPPAEIEWMSATLWFSNGPYKIYVDDISVIANTEKPAVDLAAQAGILADTPECTLWKQVNFRRVDSVGVPADVPKI
ncbi:MAG: hypothetical protein M0Q29_12590, partial [Thiopseudomonas sp.]|nr:hypothetical protein [Thiopseudomonas sp.]